MSLSRPYIAKLTQQAQNDLAEIRTYSIQQFGLEQWSVYKQRIETAIQKICRTPQLGKDVSVISPELRRYHIGRPKGSHYIYYRLTEQYLVIVRVIHDARDQENVFKQ